MKDASKISPEEIELEREKFEKYFCEEYPHLSLVRYPDGEYSYSTAQRTWKFWLAAVSTLRFQIATQFGGSREFFKEMNPNGS